MEYYRILLFVLFNFQRRFFTDCRWAGPGPASSAVVPYVKRAEHRQPGVRLGARRAGTCVEACICVFRKPSVSHKQLSKSSEDLEL